MTRETSEVLRLCTICVRGGSKGVPGKNIRPIGGKPLLAHSIDQARATGLFSAVGVSSDSDEILDIARRHGADHLVVRPDRLATDTAAKLPVIRHCVEVIEAERGQRFDILVDLDATSPLRLPSDIAATVAMLAEPRVDTVITGMPSRRSPYFNMVERDPEGGIRLAKTMDPPPVRRQDAPECFDMNASIYAWRRHALFANQSLFGRSTRLHVMPEDRSIDIDTPLDFKIVELLLSGDRD